MLDKEITEKVRLENDVKECNSKLENLSEKLEKSKEEKEPEQKKEPKEEKEIEQKKELKEEKVNELEKIYDELKDFDCSMRGGKWTLEELKKLNNILKDKFKLKTDIKSSAKKQEICETLKKVIKKKLDELS